MELGKTGKFPDGKLNEQDEGEIRLAVGVQDGNVIINFGSSVRWIGLPPEGAIELAELILSKASANKRTRDLDIIEMEILNIKHKLLSHKLQDIKYTYHEFELLVEIRDDLDNVHKMISELKKEYN